uniref:Uncharacterized protein n=1 Tax=Candidatus Kentrum sp. LFY TaxID=2126342 RepID=A0A450UNG9_9GAMM|nr:MAG: hypothetical protein BECKLFY1418B_GA0070995_105319 [Candidatus Kentron sp. LFY]
MRFASGLFVLLEKAIINSPVTAIENIYLPGFFRFFIHRHQYQIVFSRGCRDKTISRIFMREVD